MKYQDCLLYCVKEIAAKDQDDLDALRLLLNYPKPSPNEWAEVLGESTANRRSPLTLGPPGGVRDAPWLPGNPNPSGEGVERSS